MERNKCIALVVLLWCASIQAAPLPITIPILFKWQPSQAEMAGLSTNDYTTNVVFNLLSTLDVATPTNQWPVIATWPAIQFTNQGPVGSTWSNTITTSDSSRFFAMTVSNVTVGGVSPFSNLVPWFQIPTSGVLLPLRR